MNPETSLVWHPLKDRLNNLRMLCLANKERPPHWFRVETESGSGYPDLWWAWGRDGTIELKHRHSLPVGVDTPCAIDSIQPSQRLFWRQSSEAGGSCHVLTRVGREWFLHEGGWARQWLGVVPIADLRAHSLFCTPVLCPGTPLGEQMRCTELPDARTILLLCGAVL